MENIILLPVDQVIAAADSSPAAPVVAARAQTPIETARARFKDYEKAIVAANHAGTTALYAAMDLGDAVKALKKIAPARRQEAWMRDYIPGISKTIINECVQLAEARERIELELTGSAGQMSIRAALRFIRGKKAAAQANAAANNTSSENKTTDASEQETNAGKFEEKVDRSVKKILCLPDNDSSDGEIANAVRTVSALLKTKKLSINDIEIKVINRSG